MANSVLKLTVDTHEYDASLKDAQRGMQALEQSLNEAGKTFADVDKKVVDYARELGNMEATSRTATGKLNEMKRVFTELSVQYGQLSDQEKQSPFGQALSQSLETLKQRTQEARQRIDEATASLQTNNDKGKESGGVLEALADKFTINIDAVKLFNAGLEAAKVVLDVAKDAFFASEASVDEWGRTVASAESVYQGFLTSINTGDISGFLGRIDQIVTAARAAYDELDRLGTTKTIQAPQVSAQQTENDRFRMMIQTGRYIAPIDGRKATMQNGQLLTPAQIKTLERQLEGGLNKMVSLVGNEVRQTSKAIDAVYKRQGAELGMSVKEFRKGTSSMAEFDKRMAGYAKYQEWNAKAQADLARQGGRGGYVSDKNNPYLEFKKWGVFRVDGDRYNDLVRLIQQRDQQASGAYSMQGQAYRTMNRAEGLTVRKIMGGSTGAVSSGSGRGGGSTQLTPAQQASQDIEKANKDYAAAINAAKERMEANLMDKEQYDKQLLSGQEKLAEAYLKAYDATGNEEYLSAFKATAEKILEYRGVVDANAEAQKAAEQAAREQAEAQKRLADALAKRAEQEATFRQNSDSGVGAFISNQQAALAKADYGSADYSQLSASLADANTYKNLMQTAIQHGLNDVVLDAAPLWQKIVSEQNIEDADWEALQTTINEKLKELGIEPISIDFKTGDFSKDVKKATKEWESAASAIQSVGSAMSQIEDPAAKVMGTIAQAVASIALGAAQAIGQAGNGSAGGPWGWIAFAAAATATMISTIASVHSATGYANGGIVGRAGGGYVPGGSYSGDNVMGMVDGVTPVGLNSGELILNASQQNAVAASLQGGGAQSIQVEGVISGEKIHLVHNRFLRRSGKGELVTW